MRVVIKTGLAILLSVTAIVFFGCATRNTLFVEADDATADGSFLQAIEILEENRGRIYSSRDQVLYYLDTGMLYHYAGASDLSSAQLAEAEMLIEEYFTESLTQAASTILMNDTAMNYGGEDFEDIYLNLFRSINYLDQGQPEAAMVEVRRITNKLNLLEDKYAALAEQYTDLSDLEGDTDEDLDEGLEKVETDDLGFEIEAADHRFHNSALARYVGMTLRRASGDYDGARIDYEQLQDAFATQASLYDFENPIGAESRKAPEDARLSVLAFTGRSPIKEAQTFWLVTGTNTVSIVYAEEDEHLGRVPQGFASFAFPGVPSGLRFKFEIPRMRLRGSDISAMRVYADDRMLGELSMIENMEQVAREAFRTKEPFIFIRSAVRTVLKGVAGYHAKQAIEASTAQLSGEMRLAGSILGAIGGLASDAALEASEKADLRISRYFPAYAHMGEWDLEEGTYDITVAYYRNDVMVHSEVFPATEVTERGPNLLSSMVYR